jgi:hypothetical protein
MERSNQVEIVPVAAPDNPNALDSLFGQAIRKPGTEQGDLVAILHHPPQEFFQMHFCPTAVGILQVIPIERQNFH